MQSGYEKLAYRNNLSGVKDIPLKIHNFYHLINKKQWGFIILQSHKDITMAGLFLGWGVGFSFLFCFFFFFSSAFCSIKESFQLWVFSSVVLKTCYGKLVAFEGKLSFQGRKELKQISFFFFFAVKFKTLLMLLNWYIILMPLRTPIIKNSPEFSLVWVSLFSFQFFSMFFYGLLSN